MATVYYLGFAQAVPGVRKLAISGPVAADTVTITVTGSGKFVKYTVVTGDTAATVVTALLGLWAASTQPEITEIAAVVNPASTSEILFTGPANGATFTIATTKTGTVTVTDSNVTTETGPYHADNVTNYSSGGLPANSDTLVFAQGDKGPQFALTAITATALVVRRDAEFTGRIGLPEQNPNGYREYRTAFLQLDVATINFESSSLDVSQQFRIQANRAASGATAVNVYGADSPRKGETPVLEIYGLAGASTITGANASIGLALQPAQVATVDTVNLSNANFQTGPGVTHSTSLTLNETQATCWSTVKALTVLGDTSEVIVTGSAGATGTTTIQEGALRWRATGSPSTTVVGTGATLDALNSPVTLAAFNISAYAGCVIDNRAGKLAATSVITPVNCTWNEFTYLSKSNEAHTL